MCIKRPIEYDKVFRFLVFLCPVVIILYCFSSGISGNDFWWHIKVGEYVLESGEVPTSDIFSWYGTSVGLEWTAHEWLSDLVFYVVYSTLGNIGIFSLSVVGAILLYFLLLKEGWKYAKTNILLSGLLFSLFAVLTSLFFYGRPHIFSFFLLLAELKVLYSFYENPKNKSIWLVPVIAIAWSNLHGGSSNLSYLLCIIFLLVGLCNFNFGRLETNKIDRRQMMILLMVTIMTVAALLVNPIGYRVLIYPYANLSDSLSMTVISEWQAPDAKQIGNLILYFLPIVLMSIGIVCGTKKLRLIDLVVMLAFLFLFFRSARFIMLWYIASVFCAFRYMPEMKVKAIQNVGEKIAVWLLTAVLVLCSIMSISETVNTYNDDMLISKVVSDQSINVIKDDRPERLFNDYNLGETLIYNDIPVFFDARADLYAHDNIMADGVSLMYLEQANKTAEQNYVAVDELIEKYGFDAVAILKVRPLYSYMVSHPERFSLVYEDSTMAYYRITGGVESE